MTRRRVMCGAVFIIAERIGMRIKVICIGNELMLDDGLGPALARYMLSRYRFPQNVEIVDRATMGMGIISDLRTCDVALVADALMLPDEWPGRLFMFKPEDAAPTPAGAMSLHETRFADVLASAELLGIKAKGQCFGMQVQNPDPSEFICALTPQVAATLPYLATLIVSYMRNYLSIDIEDMLKENDIFTVGSSYKGARDFSKAGIKTTGIEPAQDLIDAIPAVDLPEVYGEPTSEAAVRSLEAGFEGQGLWLGSDMHDDADHRCMFEIEVPQTYAEQIASKFGLEVSKSASQGDQILRGYVHTNTTDYDLYALIEACAQVCDCE